MIIYLIDAFNLIHKIGSMNESPYPHSELIRFIREGGLTGSNNNKVYIVFDGHEPQNLPLEREYALVFSKDKSADEIIKLRILRAKNTSQLMVVSDDNDVINFAKREGARTISTRDFLNRKIDITRSKLISEEKELSYASRTELNRELEKIWVK